MYTTTLPGPPTIQRILGNDQLVSMRMYGSVSDKKGGVAGV